MHKRLGLLAWLVPLGASALVAAFGTRDPADLPYFAHAARTLLAEGHRQVHLVVTEANPARALYERLGFREVPVPRR